jgi:hypothetical protein
MHNLRSYENDAGKAQGIIQDADLAAIDYLKPRRNDELFNRLKHGARVGASMLAQMSQEHNLNAIQIFEQNKIIEETPKSIKQKLKK